MNLSRHFTLAELTHSDTAAREGIPNQPGVVEVAALRALCSAVLDPLREAVGRPIKVNSGYRGPALNRRIGGATSSQHLCGQAADIQSPGMAVLELFKTVIRLGLPFDQVIYEAQNANTKWVHVSHKPGAHRGEIRIAEFGANGRPTGYPRVSAQQALAMVERTTRSARAAAEPGYVERADEPEHEAPEAAGSMLVRPRPQAGAKAAAAKKAVVKKTAAKKATAKKATAKKAAVKTTTARKLAVEKAAVKKTAAKKSAAKKSRPAAAKVSRTGGAAAAKVGATRRGS